MGSALVHDSLLFLLSAGVAILVLVTAHETIPTWYSSFGSSPIGALVICSGCFFGDAILRCFFLFGCHALHKPSPHGLGCSCALAYVSFIFRVLASCSSGPMLALKSLTLGQLGASISRSNAC